MNWLEPLTREILAMRKPSGAQRRALVLWANELSAICDQLIPDAPAPDLEPAVGDDGTIRIHWILNDRVFSLSVTPGYRALLAMNDPKGQHRVVDPTHQELRRYVLCLFDGWRR